VGGTGAVDDDEHVRLGRDHRIDGLADAAQEARHPHQDGGEAVHRDVVERKQAIETLRRHRPSADAAPERRRIQ
jgi:hypothetical protein